MAAARALLAHGLLLAAAAAAASVAPAAGYRGSPEPFGMSEAGGFAALLRKWNVFDSLSGPWSGSGPRLTSKRLHLEIGGSANSLSAGDLSDDDIGHYAGYFRLNRTHDARMFYFFFESRRVKKDGPLVLWMTGGPGCASELALFYENGPFVINDDNKTLSWNDYGWDLASNIIFVDQPINTGFSYSSDPRDMRHDEKGVGEDVYEFLQAFFLKHPEFAGRDFFVTGESYGGKYVPAVASKIHLANKAKEGPVINLKGFAIGNGLTKPEVQFAAFPDFAHKEGLISDRQHDGFQKAFVPCGVAARACGTKGKLACAAAFVVCEGFFSAVLAASGDGNRNVYDIRLPCKYQPLCYDFSALDQYLAQTSVREALGVGQRQYQQCSSAVYQAMLMDFMRNEEPVIPPLLEDGIRMLAYVGEADFICNWLGVARFVSSMKWSGQAEYLTAPWTPFEVANKSAGIATGFGPLTYLKVYEAGHMVPRDQPKASLVMLHKFLKGESFVSSSNVVPAPHPTAKSNHEAEAWVSERIAAEDGLIRAS